MALDSGDAYFSGTCGHATRIGGVERWLNHAPTPVDLHHSSFAVAIHPFDHLRG